MIKKFLNSNFYKKVNAFNTKLAQKTLFSKQIQKIKKEGIRNYFLKLFALNVIFYKSLAIIYAGLIVFLSGFLVRQHAINLVLETGQTELGEIFNFTINNGIALGTANSNPDLVYTLQSIPIIFGGIAFLLAARSWYYVPIIFLVFAGLGNIIDRAIPELELVGIVPFTNSGNGGGNDIYDGVVDYWRFAKSVINIFDVYIVISICFVVLAIIVPFFIKKPQKPADHSDLKSLSKEIDVDVVEVSNKQFGYDEKEDQKEEKKS